MKNPIITFLYIILCVPIFMLVACRGIYMNINSVDMIVGSIMGASVATLAAALCLTAVLFLLNYVQKNIFK